MLYFFVSCLFRCVLFFFKILIWKSNMLYFFVSCLFRCVLFFFNIFWKLNVLTSVESCLLLCFLYFLVCWLVRRVLQEPSGVGKKPKSRSDNNKVPQTKYDVFVSFRGEDVRGGFLSHLVDIFKRNKINAYVDEKLEKGGEVWPSLVEAIEQSFISLIVFSQDYASSRWCLEELKTILKCNKKYGQIVIPVFYYVKPTDVRHQTGSYQKAFADHEKEYKNNVRLWRHALTKSANISGFVAREFRNDVELLKEIVKLVLTRLDNSLVNSNGLVGIDEEIANVESLIHKDPKDTRLIGIWGMGGIGKTTFAKEIFNKLRYEYEGCYFLASVREKSIRHGIDSLKKEIFSGLLAGVEKTDAPNLWSNDIDRRIGRMKVLIILDDVNDSGHLEELLGSLDNFGSGSRIIITTRDKQVLTANKAEIHGLGELSPCKALELFKLNAFTQSNHPREFDELSEKVIDYAKGNPLVLKVLAHLLRGKNKEVWESQLHKVEKMPLTKVYDAMKLSYDDLDRKEQQIFLDLACFFLGLYITVNVDYLKSLLKDGESDNSVVVGLERLKDKALITFCENFVFMHDSLQEMAWEIVRRDYSEDLGSHSHLWDPNDIYKALKDDKSIESIRSIRIHLPTFKMQKLSTHAFAKMKKLQFLEICGKCKNDDCSDQHNILAEGFQFLETELRFLCWYYYPGKSLPKNFPTEKLVILKLPKGEIKNLWHEAKNLVNLKELDLTDSKMLEELPDLSNATNLEVLILEGCSMLSRVHPSIFSLGKLENLNLRYCKSLTILTSNSHLSSLRYLNLDKCEKLKKFSLITENIIELRLRWTKVKEFSSSFGNQCKLKLLDLEGSAIERLPSSIKDLIQLSHLDVSSCSELQKISKLPPSLKFLYAKYCPSLTTLEELPSSLKTLGVGNCKSLQTLPKLPRFLKTLTAENCTSLKTVLFPSAAVEQLAENRKKVLFLNCLKLDQQSLESIALNALINVMKFANQHLSTPNHDDIENYKDYDKKLHSYQVVYVYPGSSVPKWLEYETEKNYINIDLSSAPPSPLEGFIFCFALGEYGDKTLERIEANITISHRMGKGKKDSVEMYIGLRNGTIESDHLCVMYDQRCSAFLYTRAKNQKKFKIKVSMVLRSSSKEISILPQQMFKGFGISPISTLAYDNFVQQMELLDSM